MLVEDVPRSRIERGRRGERNLAGDATSLSLMHVFETFWLGFEAGRDLLADCSSTFDEAIARNFLEPLSPDEVAQLGAIWDKLLAASRA